ncbi:MAG: YjjW family glycine radical enzyme activase [Clostridia bacterium BRH_c25]|nr:MAG: YjjW family glycine radical enzyme activase [Clostridia bacterium BRH_c25]
MSEALVNRILPFSSVDGPGNRTVVFFQGCNFNCAYCHNPETINRCSDCGLCLSACPAGALGTRNGKVIWDSTCCTGCDACLAECCSKSSPKAVYMTIAEIMKTIDKVRPFISGITASGGECTLQKEFLAELFLEVHKSGLTAYVDTNGSIDFSKEKMLTNSMDKVMLDIKSLDEEEHRMLTGMSNSIVLKNVKYLAELDKLYEIRTVIVPGLLDNGCNVVETGRLIAKLNPNIRYKLIKFRPIGVPDNMKKTPIPSDELMEELKNYAEKEGCRDVIVV